MALTALFVVYWMATLLVVAHNNPLRVELHRMTTGLAQWLPQQWTFFSPPSTANRRIRFHYLSETREPLLVLDVLEPVLAAKRARRPFNYAESKLDYILNHSCDLLASRVVSAREQDPALNADAALGEYMRNLAEVQPMAPELRTLLLYGRDALRRQALPGASAAYLELVVTDVPIRRFAARHATTEIPERTNFRSGPVALSRLLLP